jgi:hypothetical protein
MALTLRVDPWASEYEGALQFPEADDEGVPPLGLRLDIEVEKWEP